MIYRLRKPLQVIRDEPPNPISFVEIMPGSIITIKGEVRQSGLVDVLYDGQIPRAYMQDIQARADLVRSFPTALGNRSAIPTFPPRRLRFPFSSENEQETTTERSPAYATA